MLPRRVPVRSTIEGLDPTTDLVGFEWENLGSLTTGWRISPALPGVIDIREVWWSAESMTGAAKQWFFQFAVGSTVPTTQAGMDVLPQVFPMAGLLSSRQLGRIWVSIGGQSGRFSGRFRVNSNGEALVVGARNDGSASASAYLGMIVERVEILEAPGAVRGVSGPVAPAPLGTFGG